MGTRWPSPICCILGDLLWSGGALGTIWPKFSCLPSVALSALEGLATISISFGLLSLFIALTHFRLGGRGGRCGTINPLPGKSGSGRG